MREATEASSVVRQPSIVSGETPEVNCNSFLHPAWFMLYTPALTLERKAPERQAGARYIKSRTLELSSTLPKSGETGVAASRCTHMARRECTALAGHVSI